MADHCRLGLDMTKGLPEHALGAIPENGPPKTPRRDDAETITAKGVRTRKHGEVPHGDAGALLLDRLKLPARTQPDARTKPQGHGIAAGRRPIGQRSTGRLSLGYGHALAALGSPALEHDTAVLGPHTHKKSMGAPATAAVAAETCASFGSRPGGCPPRRNPNRSGPVKTLSMCARPRQANCAAGIAVVDSPPAAASASSDEFSTPVEKTVEILGITGDDAEDCRIARVPVTLRQGEYRTRCQFSSDLGAVSP